MTYKTQFPIERFTTLRTPFYYYDMQLLKTTLAALRKAAEGMSQAYVHYAVKANANPEILRLIAAEGFGADCVSGGEVEAALAAGFPASRVVFAGVGKSDWEINTALEAGIACFNVESLPELEVINELAGRQGCVANVAFRVNPNVDAHTHEKITTGLHENKFGIAMEDLVSAIRCAEALPHISYAGLHFHIGSQILDMTVYGQLCDRINALQDALEGEGITTPGINVGGGLGIDYDFPDANPVPCYDDYFAVFGQKLQLREGQSLHFELGRSVVAQCGSLIARTLYVKKGHTKQFLIVDAGFTELIRPAMYGAFHAVQNLTAGAGEPETVYDVVGPICESSDVFAASLPLPTAHRGDLIAFRSAGAYGEVMASQYNCRRLPQAYYSE